MSTQRVTRPWTKSEDSVLREAVSQFSQSETVDWHRVASHLPRRNNKECRKRWVYSLESRICKGPWDEEEDRCLKNGVAKHGLKWAAVAEVVGSRQPDQCSRRWHEVVNPRISHERWSLLEDSILKEAVDTYGRKWTEIVERFFPNRTPISARNRYKQRYEGRGSVTSTEEERSGSTSSDDQRRASLLWTIPDHTQNSYDGSGMSPVPTSGASSSSHWASTASMQGASSPSASHPSQYTSNFHQLSNAMTDNPFAQSSSNRQMYPTAQQHRGSIHGSSGVQMQAMAQALPNVASTMQAFGGVDNLDLLSEADTASSFDGTHGYPSPMTSHMQLMHNGNMNVGASQYAAAAAAAAGGYGYGTAAVTAAALAAASAIAPGTMQASMAYASPTSYAATPMPNMGFTEEENRRLLHARAQMRQGVGSSGAGASSSRAGRAAPRVQSMAYC